MSPPKIHWTHHYVDTPVHICAEVMEVEEKLAEAESLVRRLRDALKEARLRRYSMTQNDFVRHTTLLAEADAYMEEEK